MLPKYPPSRLQLHLMQAFVLAIFVLAWHLLTRYEILDTFFFASPVSVVQRFAQEFASGSIYHDLWITLIEAVLAFIAGSAGGLCLGLLLARAQTLGAVFDPFIKAANAIPRVVLAPIFALWFGLGIWSKVALGITLVFFVVFFNVYQGIREVNVVALANARMLGLNDRQLMRHVYLPSALSWVFSSLHTAVGFAVVGAVIGEYLGASAGLGYRIAQAESVFDIVGVFTGMAVLTIFVLVIDALVSLAEARLLKWRRPVSLATA